MNKQELVEKIEFLIANRTKFEALLEPLRLEPESPLYDCFYELMRVHLECLDELKSGIKDWIYWYIYDNDCGKAGLKAGVNKDSLEAITTVDQLVDLILSEC